MEIWTLIVKSNAFNFLILLGLIIFAIKFFKVGGLIEKACIKVKENVESSDLERENSQKELKVANETAKNIANEVKEIFDNAQKSAKLIGEKIMQDANTQVKSIEQNAKKTIESEGKKIALNLTQKTALASLEVAKSHIINTLEQKPQYHNDFIQKSIDELDRLKTNE